MIDARITRSAQFQGAVCSIAGADVQKDRLELEIVAWGRDRESWSVDYRVLQGDPAKADVWIALTPFWPKASMHETGVNLAIIKLAIDTGYATQEVYDWYAASKAIGY